MSRRSFFPPPASLGRPRFPSYVQKEAPPAARRVPFALALGALGVVYGDIGTNPLFALGEAFGSEHAVAVSTPNILGVLSLIFWALMLVITVKYLTFVMRASNDGEGGILALLGLIPATARPRALIVVILVGAALLYGDGVITPAISVLSAVEGLKLAAPAASRFIVPITIVILVLLFLVQRRGTQGIGLLFGPVMVVWFLIANLRKFLDGGWVPFGIGMLVFLLFSTWMAGRRRLGEYLASVMVPLPAFLEDVATVKPPRVRGTAVFMTANTGGAPVLLLHHFKHNQVLHENVVLLTVTSGATPYVKPEERIMLDDLGHGFYRLVARFGYMETPNVPDLLRATASLGLPIDLARTTYYLGRETLLPGARHGMWRWQKFFFSLISRNSKSATACFGIPPNRVVELGMQIEL